MIITAATASDGADWAALRQALWPRHGLDTHAAAIAQILAAPKDLANFVARTADGSAVGIAEAALRHDYVNGCQTSPVAFLEGIYVVPEHRRNGVASMLVDAVEDWARRLGCSEFASDAAIDNTESHRMHAALGFEETQRVVYFRKALSNDPADH
ncbi:GNAT family N-acetyltransferase [Devosia sp. J2-20]|uniref:aminoglycoside 6'-N-acetyltransferase n=1 Tax=Devosia sp. J2-20 TaxID=3026161 RepID=UPI00249CAEE4|nr:aminoglycoside 6'-N-acetyltransferase [Devosia sp. J2-20]WDR00827.1 GNAT family N-acetyltransferase [Devosia sp. J2-20]